MPEVVNVLDYDTLTEVVRLRIAKFMEGLGYLEFPKSGFAGSYGQVNSPRLVNDDSTWLQDVACIKFNDLEGRYDHRVAVLVSLPFSHTLEEGIRFSRPIIKITG